MRIKTQFSPITEAQKQQLNDELKGILSEEDYDFFVKYVKPYDKFGNDQLDNVFLIAEVTLGGHGIIKSLRPDCTVDQEDWPACEDEPDIRIEPVSIPLKLITPKMPLEIKSSKTFLAVLQAEGNIWDSCKDLPRWIWNERRFEFMLLFSLITEKGKRFVGNKHKEYARELIKF